MRLLFPVYLKSFTDVDRNALVFYLSSTTAKKDRNKEGQPAGVSTEEMHDILQNV